MIFALGKLMFELTPVRSLNVSALAFLPIVSIDPFPGHIKLGLMIRQVTLLMPSLSRSVRQLVKQVEGTVAEEIQRSWIRVPLDFQRDDVKSLRWPGSPI